VVLADANTWLFLRELPCDLPVMPRRIDNPADPPSMGIEHGRNLGRPGRDRPPAQGHGVLDNEKHPDRAAAEGLGAEVKVLGRLVGDPELGAGDGQLSHTAAGDAVQLGGAECCLIESDGPTAWRSPTA
jgi:hypothetical protein